MSIGTMVSLLRDAVWQVFIISSPALFAALLIGLLIAFLMATTSIQEQTLTFLPKLLVILFVLALLSGMMFARIRGYTINLFQIIPSLAHS